MTTLFISDLHLDSSRPEIGHQLIAFLESEAVGAEALYVLGDLFETWVGDDDPNEHYATIKAALKALVDGGVPVFFMHGNRDFMIGNDFSRETGVKILSETHILNLYGQTVLLTHGDLMCTDDVKYQAFRKMTRNPEWQTMMLEKPLAERLAVAAHARAASAEHGKTVSLDISDVNQTAVEEMFRENQVFTMLHGHTHRPATHEFQIDGTPATRIVLGDWYEQGSVVRWDADGPNLASMPR